MRSALFGQAGLIDDQTVLAWDYGCQMLKYTPPKFNMEPENDGFQEELPFLGTSFSGSMLNFGGVWIENQDTN